MSRGEVAHEPALVVQLGVAGQHEIPCIDESGGVGAGRPSCEALIGRRDEIAEPLHGLHDGWIRPRDLVGDEQLVVRLGAGDPDVDVLEPVGERPSVHPAERQRYLAVVDVGGDDVQELVERVGRVVPEGFERRRLVPEGALRVRRGEQAVQLSVERPQVEDALGVVGVDAAHVHAEVREREGDTVVDELLHDAGPRDQRDVGRVAAGDARRQHGRQVSLARVAHRYPGGLGEGVEHLEEAGLLGVAPGGHDLYLLAARGRRLFHWRFRGGRLRAVIGWFGLVAAAASGSHQGHGEQWRQPSPH